MLVKFSELALFFFFIGMSNLRLMAMAIAIYMAVLMAKSTEGWFLAGGSTFWIGGGLEKLCEGRNLQSRP